jgi:hypothetical protein
MELLNKLTLWPLPQRKYIFPGPFEAGVALTMASVCLLVYALAPQMIQLVVGSTGFENRLKEKRTTRGFLRRSVVRIMYVSIVTLLIAYEMLSLVRQALLLVEIDYASTRRSVDIVSSYTMVGHLAAVMSLVGLTFELLLHPSALPPLTPRGLWIYDLIMTVSAVAAVGAELYLQRASVPVALILSALAPRVFESFRSVVAFLLWTPSSQPGRRLFSAFIFMVHLSVGVLLAPLYLSIWTLRQRHLSVELALETFPLQILIPAVCLWVLQVLHSGGLFLEIFRSPKKRSAARRPATASSAAGKQD